MNNLKTDYKINLLFIALIKIIKTIMQIGRKILISIIKALKEEARTQDGDDDGR